MDLSIDDRHARHQAELLLVPERYPRFKKAVEDIRLEVQRSSPEILVRQQEAIIRKLELISVLCDQQRIVAERIVGMLHQSSPARAKLTAMIPLFRVTALVCELVTDADRFRTRTQADAISEQTLATFHAYSHLHHIQEARRGFRIKPSKKLMESEEAIEALRSSSNEFTRLWAVHTRKLEIESYYTRVILPMIGAWSPTPTRPNTTHALKDAPRLDVRGTKRPWNSVDPSPAFQQPKTATHERPYKKFVWVQHQPITPL